MGVLPRWLAF